MIDHDHIPVVCNPLSQPVLNLEESTMVANEGLEYLSQVPRTDGFRSPLNDVFQVKTPSRTHLLIS